MTNGQIKNALGVCENGADCQNPIPKLRPTRLKGSSAVSGICSYCLGMQRTIDAQAVRIDSSLLFEPLRQTATSSKPEMILDGSRGVGEPKPYPSHDGHRAPGSLPSMPASLDARIGAMEKLHDDSIRRDGDLSKSAFGALSGDQHSHDDPFAVVSSDQTRKDIFETPIYWLAQFDRVITPKTREYGFAVREKLFAFFNNRHVTDETKKSLLEYIKSLRQPTYLATVLTSSAVMGRARLEGLWRSGFQGIGGISGEFANAATFQCDLKIDDRVETLTAIPEDRRLMVRANPLLMGVLNDKAISTAVAHEFYHHSNNHYGVLGKIVENWKKNSSSLISEETFSSLEGKLAERLRTAIPSLDQRSLRQLANRAFDCVTNAATDAKELEVDPGERSSREFQRKILAVAVALGSSVREENGRFYIPLHTLAGTSSLYGVRLTESDTARQILEKLIVSVLLSGRSAA